MKERTHESIKPDFYAQLQESIWNGLEEDVKGQEPQEHSGEDLNLVLALPMSSDESQLVEGELQERPDRELELEQQIEHSEANSKHPNSTTEPSMYENLELDFYTKQPEKFQPALEEDEEYSSERLSLREMLNEWLHTTLDPKQAITRIKEYRADQKKSKTQPKKRKLITRMDKVVLLLIILLSVGYIGTGGQASQSNTNSIQTSHIKGMGSVNIPADNPQNQTPYGCTNDPMGSFINAIHSLISDITSQAPATAPNDWLTGSLNYKYDPKTQMTSCTYVSGGAAFQTDLGTTATDQTDKTIWANVTSVWQGVDGIVGSFLVIMFILAGYRVFGGALGFRYAEALESLPRVILAVVASLLSLTFVDLIIQINNGLCLGMMNLATGVQVHTDVVRFLIPSSDWFIYIIVFFFANVVMLFAGILLAFPGINWVVGALLGTIGLVVYISSFRLFVLTVLSIMLAVQLVMRFIMINVFIILSPLGIACWGFPNRSMQEIARAWCMGFLKLVFVQFIQVSCLAVGMIAIPALTWNLADLPSNFSGNNLLAFIGPIAILWLTVRVPRMLGSAVLGTVEAAGQSVGQAIGGSVVR